MPSSSPSSPALPSLSDATMQLLQVLSTLEYNSAMALRVLGPAGLGAASSGAPQAALWHCERSDAPAHDKALIRAFYLRQATDRGELGTLIGSELVDALLADGSLTPTSTDARPNEVRSALDIRPISVGAHGAQDVLIASDPDASMEDVVPGPDHVPGVGHAPLSLLNNVPPVPEGSRVLDLGCGSGVLSLVLAQQATDAQIIGTDISLRALEFARLNGDLLASNTNTTVTWRHGSWFEPVAGERFDMIVANPPFVIGPALVGHVYRDSGLPLDGATSTVVGGAAEHLDVGGTAHILAGWALGSMESAASRVSSWLPSHGVRAWVVQREEVDTATYVTTWLEDESLDPRHEDGRARTQAWLDFFADNEVTRVGLGYVHLQKIDDDQTTEITFEVLDHPLPSGTYLGAEVAEFFARAEWLSDKGLAEILGARYAVRPTTALEEVGLPQSDEYSSQGFQNYVTRITRTDGPAWSHEVDEPVVKVLAGLHPQALALEDVAELYCAVQGLDSDEFSQALVPIVVDLVRHGMIIPAELLSE